ALSTLKNFVILYSGRLSSSMAQSNLCHEAHCFLTTRASGSQHTQHRYQNKPTTCLPSSHKTFRHQTKREPTNQCSKILTIPDPSNPTASPKLCRIPPPPFPVTPPKTIAAHFTSQPRTFQASTIHPPSTFPRNPHSSLIPMP